MVRQTLKFAACLLASSVLAACSSPSSDAETRAAAEAADQPPAAEVRNPTVLDDQLKALDKARAVEETLEKAKADRDKQIDEQSGG